MMLDNHAVAVAYVELEHVPGGAWASLRELCGYDEQVVADTTTRTALRLLDRLLCGWDGAEVETTLDSGLKRAQLKSAALTASDRDRLLAAVYTQTYGPRIEATLRCQACDKPFDMDFSLPDLQQSLFQAEKTLSVESEAGGVYRLPDGRRFRLPTGEDECAVEHLPPGEAEQALLVRCLLNGDEAPASDRPAADDLLQTAMREVAPLLDLDLQATCPECEAVQTVHFDIQSYLLSAIKSERRQLAQEVHRLAVTYHWSLDEILRLSRSQRRLFISLIESDLAR